MDLIIFAHPDNQKSHNAAILRYVKSRLNANSRQYEVIDLYSDGFDPVLRLTKEDDSQINLVQKYQDLISQSERLIFIYPVWWYNVPGILKGFIEKVFNSGLSHGFSTIPGKENYVERKLVGKTAVVINTYGRTKADAMKRGNPVHLILDRTVLEFSGIEVTSRIEWFDVKGPGILKGDIAKEIDMALA